MMRAEEIAMKVLARDLELANKRWNYFRSKYLRKMKQYENIIELVLEIRRTKGLSTAMLERIDNVLEACRCGGNSSTSNQRFLDCNVHNPKEEA